MYQLEYFLEIYKNESEYWGSPVPKGWQYIIQLPLSSLASHLIRKYNSWFSLAHIFNYRVYVFIEINSIQFQCEDQIDTLKLYLLSYLWAAMLLCIFSLICKQNILLQLYNIYKGSNMPCYNLHGIETCWVGWFLFLLLQQLICKWSNQ